MGADLYIKKMNPEITGLEVSNRAVNNGYFRDPYNSCGMFFLLSKNTGLDFSWWVISRRKELFNKKGDMTIKGAKTLLSEVEQAKSKLDTNNLKDFEYIKMDAKGDGIYISSEMVDQEFFLEHIDLFIQFLNLAIKSKSTIEWSV